MDLGRIALFTLLLPFALALIGLGVVSRYCSQFWQQGIGLGLLLGLSMLCAYTAAMGWISFPFREATQILIVVGPLACLLLSLGISGEPPKGKARSLRFFMLFVVIAGLFAWLLRSLIENEWDPKQTALTLMVVAGLPAAFIAVQADRTKTAPSFPILYISGASFGIGAAAQAGSGSILLAEIQGVMALFTLALLLLRNRFDRTLLNIWALVSLAIFFPGFILLGTFYASLPQLAAALFVSGAAMAWIMAGRVEATVWSLRKQILLLTMLIVIAMTPGLGVVGYANWQKMKEASSSDYQY